MQTKRTYNFLRLLSLLVDASLLPLAVSYMAIHRVHAIVHLGVLSMLFFLIAAIALIILPQTRFPVTTAGAWSVTLPTILLFIFYSAYEKDLLFGSYISLFSLLASLAVTGIILSILMARKLLALPHTPTATTWAYGAFVIICIAGLYYITTLLSPIFEHLHTLSPTSARLFLVALLAGIATQAWAQLRASTVPEASPEYPVSENWMLVSFIAFSLSFVTSLLLGSFLGGN
jgi:hypothetical protein